MSRRLFGQLSSSLVLGCKLPSAAPFIPEYFSRTSVRTTFVLRHKVQRPQPDDYRAHHPKEKLNHMVYECVRHEGSLPFTPIQMLLTKNVAGIGIAGQLVMVKRSVARMRLIPEKKGVYATPKIIAEYEERKRTQIVDPATLSSSATAERNQIVFNMMIIPVTLNMHIPWTIEKFHIQAALRRFGIWAPEEAIELPEQQISGPHRDMHGKCFSIFLTINRKERACVLCQIELFCKDPNDALPPLPKYTVPLPYQKLPQKPMNPEPAYPGAISPENFLPPNPADRQNETISSAAAASVPAYSPSGVV